MLSLNLQLKDYCLDFEERYLSSFRLFI